MEALRSRNSRTRHSEIVRVDNCEMSATLSSRANDFAVDVVGRRRLDRSGNRWPEQEIARAMSHRFADQVDRRRRHRR